jgi:hypothetical protein
VTSPNKTWREPLPEASECFELKRENVDLATQVQSLLQRQLAESAGDMVSFDDITSLQQQNQKLLRDHYSMTDKIAELEDKITRSTSTSTASFINPGAKGEARYTF